MTSQSRADLLVLPGLSQPLESPEQVRRAYAVAAVIDEETGLLRQTYSADDIERWREGLYDFYRTHQLPAEILAEHRPDTVQVIGDRELTLIRANMTRLRASQHAGSFMLNHS